MLSRRQQRRKRRITPLAIALAATLTATLATPAIAADGDALNVRFGGSLVGTDSYTTTEGEQMLGVLHRTEGGEEQLPGGGVRLSGGSQGIAFTPSSFSLGSTTADTPFVSEMKFTPTATDTAMATLMSAGGNMFVRVKNGELEYGFSSNPGGKWSDAVQRVPLPANNMSHQLSAYYTPGDPASLHVSLDGEELAPATGLPSFPLANNAKAFGFGHDVHPEARGRGHAMILEEARVASADPTYNAAAYEFQPVSITTELLDVTFDGSLEGNNYLPTGDDRYDGTIAVRTGAEGLSDGALQLAGGRQGAQWNSDITLAQGNRLTQSFVAEVAFTPASGQVDMGTLLGVGGNLTARYKGDTLQVGYSSNASGSWKNFLGGAPAPNPGEQSVLSLAYEVHDDETVTLQAALNGVMMRPVEGASPSTTSGNPLGTLAIGNEANPGAADRGYKGSVERARFATLDAPFNESAFKLQDAVTPGPTECEPIPELSPANYITVSAGDCVDNILAKASAVRPTQQQQDWQEVGLTGFIHYGINTYYNQEWGHGTEDPARFDPTDKVDPDAWVRQLRDAGFRYAILTVKHHDGFLSYPSRYTDYDVASTPWLDGEGDVLREFTDAAHRYGMKVGVYMSPADSNQEVREGGTYGNGSAKSVRTIPTLVENDDRAGKDLPTFEYEASDYGEFFLNTLYEVLTEYGTIDEVWFDGAEGNTTKQETYDYPAFYDMISQLQPNAVVAVGGNDVRWVGNESGVARQDEWGPVAVRKSENGGKNGGQLGAFEDTGSRGQIADAILYGGANALHWWPTESDMKLTQGWFAHPNDKPKSGPQLLKHYEQTVGRNSVMLLNVPPTVTGQFAPASIDAIESFAAERRKALSQDHALGLAVDTGGESTLAATDGNARTSWFHEGSEPSTVGIDLGEARSISRVALGEDTLAHGQTVEKFRIEAEIDGEWKEVGAAGTIGQSRIVTLAKPVTAQHFRVVIDQARGSYSLANLSLYEALSADPGKIGDVYVDCAAPVAGTGTKASPFSSLEQFRSAELAQGATIFMKSGVDCAATSTPFWGYGTDDEPITVTTYGGDVQPLIGDVAAADFFAGFAERGWVTDFVDAPVVAPSITGSAAEVEAGTSVEVSLAGFAGDTEVALELHSDPVSLGSVVTDASGAAVTTVTIPADTAPGAHSIVAVAGDASASFDLTVLAAGEGPGGADGADGSGTTGGSGTTDGAGSAGGSADGDGAGAGSAGAANGGANGASGSQATDGGAKAQGGLATTGFAAPIYAAVIAALLLASGAAVLISRKRSEA